MHLLVIIPLGCNILSMSVQLDLKAIAKRAVKKSTGQYTSLKVLELFPSEKKTQKSSLEEGTLKVLFSDLGIELRNILYKIRPENKVTILLPYKAYPQEGQSKKGKKKKRPKLVAVDILSFTDSTVWENVKSEIQRQVLEIFKKKALMIEKKL